MVSLKYSNKINIRFFPHSIKKEYIIVGILFLYNISYFNTSVKTLTYYYYILIMLIKFQSLIN